MVSYVDTGSVYALAIVFLSLCTIVVIIRVIIRRQIKAFGLEDWISIIAFIFTIGCGATLIIGASHNVLGPVRVSDVASSSSAARHARFTLLRKLQFAFFPLSVLAIGLVRMAVLLFCHRVFRGNPIFRTLSGALISISVCWTAAFFFANIFQCSHHFSAFWSSQDQAAALCSDTSSLLSALSLSDVIIDFATVLLPIPQIWRLQMRTVYKVYVTGIFAVGLFSIAAGVTRAVVFLNILLGSFSGKHESEAVISISMWWSYLEIGVASLVSNIIPISGHLRLLSWRGWSLRSNCRSSGRPLMAQSSSRRSDRKKPPDSMQPNEGEAKSWEKKLSKAALLWIYWQESGLRQIAPERSVHFAEEEFAYEMATGTIRPPQQVHLAKLP